MNGAVVGLAGGLAGLRGHGAVREGHVVGGAVGLALVAVLVVHRVLLGLVALDLGKTNRGNCKYEDYSLILASIKWIFSGFLWSLSL